MRAHTRTHKHTHKHTHTHTHTYTHIHTHTGHIASKAEDEEDDGKHQRASLVVAPGDDFRDKLNHVILQVLKK